MIKSYKGIAKTDCLDSPIWEWLENYLQHCHGNVQLLHKIADNDMELQYEWDKIKSKTGDVNETKIS